MKFWQSWSEMMKNKPIWILGLVIGVFFLNIGGSTGQLEEMYRKAVMICLECIGIG